MKRISLLFLSFCLLPQFFYAESKYLFDYAQDFYSKVPLPESDDADFQKELAFDFSSLPDGMTPLMAACKKGLLSDVEYVLSFGAEINATDSDGWTALMYAARFQEESGIVKLLLSKGADCSLRNKFGITALTIAVLYNDNPAVTQSLLEPFSADSDDVRRAFFWGVSNIQNTELLQLFVEKKVSLNVPFEGKTPLMRACEFSRSEKVIEWLLEKGASKYQVEATTGMTAFDYARKNKNLSSEFIYRALDPNS